MPAIEVARAILCSVPIDLARGETKGVWLARTSKALGITISQGRRIYYRLTNRIDADRLEAMQRNFNELRERADQRRGRANDIAIAIAAYRSDARSGAPAGGIPRDGAQVRGEAAGSGSGLPQDQQAVTPVRQIG